MTSSPRTPRRGSVLGALALGADLLDDAVLGTARDTHFAVRRRVRRVGDLASGNRTRTGGPHPGLASAVYAGIGVGLRGTAGGLRAVDRIGLVPPLEDGPRGRSVVSALNGIFGDRLAERQPELAITLAVRHRGVDVRPERAALETAFPHASGDLAVFLHGLSESEEQWLRARAGSPRGYPAALRDRGWTPVLLRANTGLPVGANGVALAALLERLVDEWPVEVRRIALVGHSMGGLVMRTACAVGTRRQPSWHRLVSDVVCLGTPHLGAPIARGLRGAVRGLGVLPESAPFGALLDHRAVSITDLSGPLPDDVQNLPHARYHLVAATLSASPRHPVAEAAGDLLVRYPSAVGRSRRGVDLFPDGDVLHVPHAHHFDLLNHPAVHEALARWLAPAA